jgi:hypothetical protein
MQELRSVSRPKLHVLMDLVRQRNTPRLRETGSYTRQGPPS